MSVYLTVLFICCIILFATRNNNNKVAPLAISFGLIWAMVSLQRGWGGDFGFYFFNFEYQKGQSFHDLLVDDEHGEIGYKLFMSVMPSFQIGFAAAMAIWCFSVAFFFYHFVPQKWWFFAILFVFFDRPILMGMISSFPRMAIANSFLVFAIYLFKIKERRWGLLLLVPAFFFHKSVLFLLILFLLPTKPLKGKSMALVFLVLLFVIAVMFMPSLWVNLGQSLIEGVDAISNYSSYFDDAQTFERRGLSLLVLGYWVYLLVKFGMEDGLSKTEYLLIMCALVRIAFNMLPDLGMSVRFYYFIDLYFFAGMACIIDRLPKNDPNRWGVALTLLFVFWFLGFQKYTSTPHFIEHWATYNFIF